MKKKLALLLTAALAAGTLVIPASADEAKTLNMWTIATEGDANYQAYQNAIADYEEEHPDVTIEMESFENESYKTKIKAAVAANELPDIYFTWGGGFSSAFVEAGKSMELDSYYDAYKDDLPESTLKYATYGEKLYGVPYVVSISGIFYNKAMFEQYGLTEPQTWDELIQVCQTFIDNGITPFGVSVKEAWVMAMFNDALTLKCVGDEKINTAFTRGGQSYLDDSFVDAANKLQELISMGAFSESATGLSNDEASASFYAEQVPMYFTGSWMGGSIVTDAEKPDNFAVAPIPVVNSANASVTDFMGGGSDTLMVSASTKNKDLAAAAAFEITKGVSKYAYLSGAGIPAWTVDYDASSVPALTQQVADIAGKATSYTLWFDTLMSSDDAGEYLTLLQSLFAGDLKPEEFAASMDKQLSKK